jgi:hypothetical protein
MKYETEITADDWASANWLRSWIIACVAYVITVIAFSVMWAWTGIRSWDLVLLLFFGVWLFLWRPWRRKLWARWLYPIYWPEELGATKYEFSDDAFHVESARGSVTIPWGDIHKWKENRRTFLVFCSQAYNIVPKRMFGSDAEVAEFRRMLAGEK